MAFPATTSTGIWFPAATASDTPKSEALRVLFQPVPGIQGTPPSTREGLPVTRSTMMSHLLPVLAWKASKSCTSWEETSARIESSLSDLIVTHVSSLWKARSSSPSWRSLAFWAQSGNVRAIALTITANHKTASFNLSI